MVNTTNAFHDDDPLPDRLGEVTPLVDFEFPPPDRLTPDEMLIIAQQAGALLQGVYVHLTLKQRIYGADPIARLKVLERQLQEAKGKPSLALPEAEFHDEMVSIFTSLRDLHTTYILPAPWRNLIAFLPFMIEECQHDGATAFVVSKLDDAVKHDRFVVGALITHWNSIPIERAVQLNGQRRPGGNRAARRARAIDALTFRWLGTNVRPDENFVLITFEHEGVTDNLMFPWFVVERAEPDLGRFAADAWERVGIDREGEWIREVKRTMFADRSPPTELLPSDVFPDAFRSGAIAAEDGGDPFGYLRIHTFRTDDEDDFVAEARRIVRELSATTPRGLVVDVRGNAGGNIVAAERLLQLFTPHTVQPAPLRFRSTGLTADLVRSPGFRFTGDARRKEVLGSIEASGYTADLYSASLPLEPADVYNDVPPEERYPGPVVLIVDALSYSATDIFAAGFQDNEIGLVLGTDPATGAGGANVWSFEEMRELLDVERGLPYDASFTIAVRAASRVGARAGYPLEDLGVSPDRDNVYPPTLEDVLNGNVDLLRRAVGLLSAGGETAAA